jgi:hypothetical protein
VGKHKPKKEKKEILMVREAQTTKKKPQEFPAFK